MNEYWIRNKHFQFDDKRKLWAVTYTGKAAADRAVKQAMDAGLEYEVIRNANGCSGMYARTDAIVYRDMNQKELEEKQSKDNVAAELAQKERQARRERLIRRRQLPLAIRSLVRSCSISNAGFPWYGQFPNGIMLFEELYNRGFDRQIIEETYAAYGFSRSQAMKRGDRRQ